MADSYPVLNASWHAEVRTEIDLRPVWVIIKVAREFKLSPGTIREAEKRISNTSVFELSLLGGGSPMPIGRVAADSFRKAALGAYRSYHGTFRNLELPCWVITDGTQRIEVLELRKIDTGEVSAYP